MRRARWAPGPDSTRRLEVEAFGEPGRSATIPGPLIRVPRGTRLRVAVRNTLPDSIFVCGLAGRFCGGRDTLRIAPGETGRIETVADAAGTFLYWAGVARQGRRVARGTGGQLVGAYVVDSTTGPTSDRVFVLTSWSGTRPVGAGVDTPFVQAINGRTWPATERLAYTVGDTARWRVIAAGGPDHPMHLHGFYFRVDARGDARRDTVYGPDARRLVVTETMLPYSTMSVTWAPSRAGRWLFHCHRAAHMSAAQQLHLAGLAIPRSRDLDSALASFASDAHANHATTAMGGLVMGIAVAPSPGAPAGRVAAAPRRTLRLLVQQRAHRYGAAPGFGYVLQDGDAPPAPDSVRTPGSPIVLARDEPVAITVVNRLRRPTAVHWHGIEIESDYDGVAGWSGGSDGSAATTPMIAPGDSFVVRMTPPRAGTFIYHTHVNEEYQLTSGLYGPLLVLEPGARWDPATDHVLILAQNGPTDTASVTVNAGAPPAPISVRTGVPNRLRLINIIAQDMAEVTLRHGGRTLAWTPLAKDGATLPPAQRAERPATLHFGPGETYDFTFVPGRGATELRVQSFNAFAVMLVGR